VRRDDYKPNPPSTAFAGRSPSAGAGDVVGARHHPKGETMNSIDGPAVEARGLTKSYGKVQVLKGLSLEVRSGSVFALLGPNGAGKTTMVRILATLLDADGGEARVAGYDVRRERSAVRKLISLTGQYAAVDDLQTGEENLRTIGRLTGLGGPASRRRAAELLERFGLAEDATRRVGAYSGGMRRRLDLAASLVTEPQVLFLDEPTTGLDPTSRLELYQIVTELVATGVTVFLTTQYLEEADRLADRIAVIDAGRIVAEGTADELKRGVAEDRLRIELVADAPFAEIVSRLDGRVLEAARDERVLALRTDGSARDVRALLDTLDPDGTGVAEFALQRATLDDVFRALTGHTAGKESPNV
jgi:ABC-2 type transport system ATP-binding protein